MKPATLKRIRQNIILLLVSVLVMLGLLEVMLRTADPMGIDRLATTLRQMSQIIDNSDPRGFGIPPGTYRLRGGWTLTIDENRNRYTPNATPADCQIVFVGDSVTIGQGVNDDETWVNLLAADAPAEFVNAGFSGYNIFQVAATVDAREADGYVYLLINNDFDTGVPFEAANSGDTLRDLIQRNVLRATFVYGVAYRSGLIGGEPHALPTVENTGGTMSLEGQEDTLAALDVLVAREDVLVMALDEAPLTPPLKARHPEIVVIEPYTDVISWFDAHASATGNRQLADSAREPVMVFTEQVCS